MLDIPASPNDVRAWLKPIGKHYQAAPWQVRDNSWALCVLCLGHSPRVFCDESQQALIAAHTSFPNVWETAKFLHGWATVHLHTDACVTVRKQLTGLCSEVTNGVDCLAAGIVS